MTNEVMVQPSMWANWSTFKAPYYLTDSKFVLMSYYLKPVIFLWYFRSVILWISITYILLMHCPISRTFKYHSGQIVRCLDYNAKSYF